MRRTGRRFINLANYLTRLLEKIGRPCYQVLVWLLKRAGSFYVFFSHLSPIVSQRINLKLKKKGKRAKNRLQKKASPPPKIKKKSPKPLGKLFLKGFCWFFLVLGLLVGTVHVWILKDLPQPDRLVNRDHIVSTKIYDRNGQLLYKMYRNQNRTLVNLEEIPSSLIQATVAIEDAEFWEHHGFSWRGIIRSVIKNLSEGRLQGGSTITQQLVKNGLLTPEKTLTRKLKELVLSIQTETLFSKEEIIQMYLNEVGYGGVAYGAEEAAWYYFGKSVRNLNLAESALLAGLPASPTHYSPFGAHPEQAKQRQALVLRRMADEGFITQHEAQEAQAMELIFSYRPNNIRAPHFVMYVKELLVEKYGEQIVEEGGLEVYTSLDLDIQTMAEEVLSEELSKLGHLRVTNGAVLITQPKSGEVLAMVGSIDYFNLENDGNVNVTLQPRQPGSAIKPLTYALALEKGYTAATLISDSPISYQTPGQPPYTPTNYDNRFHGKITLRQALACSYNVPAVKVLSSLGVPQLIDFASQMGITTWNEPERYGLALTLGSAEIKMVDLAVAYGTLANLGEQKPLQPILRITDYKDRHYSLLETGKPKKDFVVNPGVAFIINDILADNTARTPTFGAFSHLNFPHQTVAVKTGTSNNLRDNWTIGYTPEFLVGVWVGNNDNTPMSRVASGVTGASPVWKTITQHLLPAFPNTSWPKPAEITQYAICPQTETLACGGCYQLEYFLSGTQPQAGCYLITPTSRETISSTQTSLNIIPTPDQLLKESGSRRKNPPSSNRST
ncbi:penicillin-binding protein [Patescibacteria group bacterium]|nr:penicillin-binding protein [Patescibacteria group bacterium]